jgi:hypothetical protein
MVYIQQTLRKSSNFFHLFLCLSLHVKTSALYFTTDLTSKSKVKQSRYTPWRRFGGEAV